MRKLHFMRNFKFTTQRSGRSSRRRGEVAKLLAIGILPLTLAACTGGGADSEDSRPTVTQTTTKPAEAKKADEVKKTTEVANAPQHQRVSLDSLAGPGGLYHFNVGSEGKGTECIIKDGGLTCIAKAPASVPNLEDIPGQPWSPFTGRPGAFTLDKDGIRWGVLEGAPPATARLNVGQRVEFDGGECQVPEANRFDCTVDGNTMTMALPARIIETSAEDITMKGSDESSGSGPGECPYPVIDPNDPSKSVATGSTVSSFCDGEWLKAGKYQTDSMWLEHYDGSQWKEVSSDGRNRVGLDAPCYSESKLRRMGAPQELIAQTLLCD